MVGRRLLLANGLSLGERQTLGHDLQLSRAHRHETVWSQTHFLFLQQSSIGRVVAAYFGCGECEAEDITEFDVGRL